MGGEATGSGEPPSCGAESRVASSLPQAVRADRRSGLLPPFTAARPAPAEVRVLVLEHDPVLGDEALEGLLPWTEADRERMGAFRHRPSLTSWCVARLLARSALSRLTGIPLGDMVLEEERGRKPRLSGSGLSFSWSHAEGCAAFACSLDAEAGVDLEAADRALPEWADLARSCYAGGEAAWALAGGDREGRLRFLSLFVQKEAALKAAGTGLSAPLASAPCVPGLPPQEGGRSFLRLLEGSGRWLLAAAASGGPARLSFPVERWRLEA